MGRVYVTSDWHFGHSGITNHFRKEFASLEEMEDTIFYKAASRLKKRDVVFYIGDMSFNQAGLDRIATLPGRKILIRGNHDTLPLSSYTEVFEDIHGALRYKGCFITHIPIHPMELYRGYNVHGHCHRGGPGDLQKGDDWKSYYNAILEFNDYDIVPWENVMMTLENRKKEVSDA